MTWTIGLGIAACGAGGIALLLSQRVWSLLGDRATLRAENAMLSRRLDASEKAHADLCEQVTETAAVYAEAERRYGFNLDRWPAVQALVDDQSPFGTSWWLLSHAPGIRALSDGRVATDRFYQFNGWRPPRLLEGR